MTSSIMGDTTQEKIMENGSDSRIDNLFDVEDICVNILRMLPVKSLGICKSVCKDWQRLIDSSEFVRSQLRWSKENPSFMFFLLENPEMIKIDGKIITKFSLPGGERLKNCEWICSINGFVFFTTCTGLVHDIHVWNPATQQVQLLPTSAPSKTLPRIRVVYGPRTNGYKIFRFFCPPGKSLPGYGECEVYSSVTGCWKGIDPAAAPNGPTSPKRPSVNNGTAYWFIAEEEGGTFVESILTVDWEENFRKISLPRGSIRAYLVRLVDVEGRLYLISIFVQTQIHSQSRSYMGYRFDLWVLEDDYNTEAIWIKKCSDYIPMSEIGYLHNAVARKKEILLMGEKGYFVYNTGTRSWNELRCGHVFRWQTKYAIAFAYTESFLSCNEVIGR